MTIDLTELAIALISLIATIITTKLIPYLHERYTNEQLNKVCKLAEIAVNAAEQLAKSGVIKPEERKEHAMNYLKDHKVKLDIDKLDDIVESYVNKLPKFIANIGSTSSTEHTETSTNEEFVGDEGIK